MKKSLYAIAALAFAFIGCTKEYNETFTPGDKLVIRAEVNDALTKVAADNSGKFSWQAGDAITVLNTEDGKAFNLTTATAGAEAAFTTDKFEGTLYTEAFYPASTSHKKGKFFLEPTFTWKEGETFMPMIGTVNTSTKKVSFKTAGAVIKLVCYNVADNARKLVVSSDTKKLSGEFTPDSGAIVAVDKGASDNTITINFAAGHPSTMVFYIPVPTDDLGKLSFVVKDDSDANVSNVQTTKGNIKMERQHMVAAPAMNCGDVPAADATLTNDEIVAKDWGNSYKTDYIDNSFGKWNFNAALQGNYGGSGKYYMQLRKNDETVSYLQLPSFTEEIASVVLHSVCNASEAKYTGSIYFRESANNAETPIATAPAATKAQEDITMTIPSGYKTGYIMVSGACRIAAFTVKFKGDTFTAPTITPASYELTIDIASGDTNTASTKFTYENGIDENAVVASVVENVDWLTPSISGSTLTVSAPKNTGAERSATVRLRATGVYADIIVTQPCALVSNPSVTVLNGNGSFSASWSGVDNASGYLAYIGTTDNLESDPTALTPLTPSYDDGIGKWSVTKSGLTNGETYYLYVKSSPVANYLAPAVYVKEVVEPTASETVCYKLTPAKGDNNGYDKNCDIAINGITWNLTGNSQMLPWRIGGKSITDTDRTLYSKAIMSQDISKIEVTHGAASSITVKSVTLVVSNNADFSSPIDEIDGGTFAASSTMTFNRPDGHSWKNCYFKFVYKLTVTSTSNKYVEFAGADFYTK